MHNKTLCVLAFCVTKEKNAFRSHYHKTLEKVSSRFSPLKGKERERFFIVSTPFFMGGNSGMQGEREKFKVRTEGEQH